MGSMDAGDPRGSPLPCVPMGSSLWGVSALEIGAGGWVGVKLQEPLLQGGYNVQDAGNRDRGLGQDG